ncbi:transcriptional regulator [Enterobacter ludwigii]|uniref:winged helix-turn-helix domain-containing protein n=1 Tax=Enterobacter ludwigii TaxID=299767 RepID=UPI0039766133
MRYCINKQIWFRVDDGSLRSEDGAVDINLTLTTCRLLTYLLERQGEVVSRDELLKNVWDANGLSSSNNSLNKYVSDIRRIFSDIGFGQDVIMTVPKVGFMLTGSIEVEKYNSHPGNRRALEKEDAAPKIYIYYCHIKRVIKNANKVYFFAVLLLIAIAISNVNREYLVNFTPLHEKPIFIAESNKCKLMTTSASFYEKHGDDVEYMNEILKRQNITCSTGDIIIMEFSDSFLKSGSGRTSIIKCQGSKSNIAKSCVSYYENNQES